MSHVIMKPLIIFILLSSQHDFGAVIRKSTLSTVLTFPVFTDNKQRKIQSLLQRIKFSLFPQTGQTRPAASVKASCPVSP